MFFGDSRDTAEFIPVHEKQTNNRGELRAALRALQSRTRGKRTLICSDSLLVVNGALGKAQKWKRHRWVGSNGPVSHVDLWEEVLSQLDVCGHEVHWIQVPSHIGIDGNHKADELADVGRRTSPLLFGHISVNMVGRVEGAGDEEEEFDELSLLGRGAEESEELQDPDTPTTPLGQVSAEPGTPVRGTPPMHRAPDRGTPLLDVEICTPVHVNKRAKPSSPPPPEFEPIYSIKRGMARSTSVTPRRGLDQFTTPRVVGPNRQTFRTPVRESPMTPLASLCLLEELCLVPMEDTPPDPLDFNVSDASSRTRSPEDTASTISCDTAGSRSSTPPRPPMH